MSRVMPSPASLSGSQFALAKKSTINRLPPTAGNVGARRALALQIRDADADPSEGASTVIVPAWGLPWRIRS